MMELFRQGGVLMYPLAVCSVAALAIILERSINLRRSKIIRPEIIQLIENIKGVQDLGLAYAIGEKNPGPFSKIMLTALELKDHPKEEIKEEHPGHGPSTEPSARTGPGAAGDHCGDLPSSGDSGHGAGIDPDFPGHHPVRDR